MNLEQGKEKITKIPFLFILLAIAVYFWVNGPSHFENWSSTYGNTIIYYIGMMVIFLYFARANTIKQLQEPLGKSAYKYSINFFGGWVFFNILVLLGLLEAGLISPDMVWSTLIIQICVVSVAEELMFRGVLLEWVGVIPQAVLFALWHSSAYGILWYNLPEVNFGSLMFALVFGLILGYLAKNHKESIGLTGTVALHSVWNICVIGIGVLA